MSGKRNTKSKKQGKASEASEDIADDLACDDEDSSASDVTSTEILSMLRSMNTTLKDLAVGQRSLENKFNAFESKLSAIETTVKDIEASVDFTSNEIITIKSRVDCLEAANQKIDSMKLQDQMDNMERFSRSFNLRFLGIPEQDGREDCVSKLENLIKSTLGLDVSIENAHRTGRSIRGNPRHVIAKFLKRPERFQVLIRRKEFSPVLVLEDLIQKDLAYRKLVSSYAKSAREAGKNVKFSRGLLYIDGVRFDPTVT